MTLYCLYQGFLLHSKYTFEVMIMPLHDFCVAWYFAIEISKISHVKFCMKNLQPTCDYALPKYSWDIHFILLLTTIQFTVYSLKKHVNNKHKEQKNNLMPL